MFKNCTSLSLLKLLLTRRSTYPMYFPTMYSFWALLWSYRTTVGVLVELLYLCARTWNSLYKKNRRSVRTLHCCENIQTTGGRGSWHTVCVCVLPTLRVSVLPYECIRLCGKWCDALLCWATREIRWLIFFAVVTSTLELRTCGRMTLLILFVV